ncbi:hypothetical protein G0U57_010930, partial [Chelydra serpentina]
SLAGESRRPARAGEGPSDPPSRPRLRPPGPAPAPAERRAQQPACVPERLGAAPPSAGSLRPRERTSAGRPPISPFPTSPDSSPGPRRFSRAPSAPSIAPAGPEPSFQGWLSDCPAHRSSPRLGGRTGRHCPPHTSCKVWGDCA